MSAAHIKLGVALLRALHLISSYLIWATPLRSLQKLAIYTLGYIDRQPHSTLQTSRFLAVRQNPVYFPTSLHASNQMNVILLFSTTTFRLETTSG